MAWVIQSQQGVVCYKNCDFSFPFQLNAQIQYSQSGKLAHFQIGVILQNRVEEAKSVGRSLQES
jgi:hypothetical protein